MPEQELTRVRTFYPADPAGIVPGGVDTFIRGLIKWAPDDIVFSLVGMTTDPVARPVGRWTRCDLGRRQFDCLPVVHVADAGSRTRVPLSLRYTWGALRHGRLCREGFDVYEFHRVEPALAYLRDPRPKNAFFHTDLAVIRTEPSTDILWRYLPGAYFAVESAVMRSLSTAWSVRRSAVGALRERYPFIAGGIHYTPTWVDTEVFAPVAARDRSRLRAAVEAELGLDPAAFRVVSVGRLDTSKDPELLLATLGRLVAAGTNVEALLIGDGVLRARLEARILAEGLGPRVRLLGLRGPHEIARLLPAADCFALTSVYEGMPMALLEALAAGLPAVTTPVGEVAQVVRTGVNGEVAADRDPSTLAACLERVRRDLAGYAAGRCAASIEAFTPARVLAPVYANYRRLGAVARYRG